MPRVWRFLPHDAALVGQVAANLHVSPLMAQVLIARGLEHQAADFLNSRLSTLYEPELLPGLSDAADRIVSAIRGGRRITIYGDYDVDGVTATALLWHCITLAGGKADYYIPSRMEDCRMRCAWSIRGCPAAPIRLANCAEWAWPSSWRGAFASGWATANGRPP
jgi:single-stranded-DNA-specific exonuclease